MGFVKGYRRGASLVKSYYTSRGSLVNALNSGNKSKARKALATHNNLYNQLKAKFRKGKNRRPFSSTRIVRKGFVSY